MDWFLAPQTLPFALAFVLILLILLVETAGMLLAASPGNLLDNLLPQDFGEGAFERVLGWLHLGKVPSLVLLVLFLLGFSLFGYALQLAAETLFTYHLPAQLAALLALPVGLVKALPKTVWRHRRGYGTNTVAAIIYWLNRIWRMNNLMKAPRF